MNNTELGWFKSSYSTGEGGECLEVAYPWRKSSHSGGEGGTCIELSTRPHAIHIRDSKNPDGPTFSVTPTSWTHFLTYAHNTPHAPDSPAQQGSC
ncbi:DUF397 domain-containing protein [Streptomyces sp. NPDC041068]|uniref:DUF397 domain-containing protein n=1 Tax=Streptomyces sp. NPDC041068 TaxID=3155130 RepID=UPI0034115834